MDILNKFHDVAEGAEHDPNKNSLNAQQALGLEPGPLIINNAHDFLVHGKSLRDADVKHLDTGIKCMNAGLRVGRFSNEMLDKGGRRYIFIDFVKARGYVSCKLILEGGMEELFNAYLDGKVTVRFTLSQLIEEAKKH
ncbi:hypothetical protein [Mucilaginibacter dorajii]|nr:hypothetical protein [Mucilaginibacter dorajii]MCS3736938.1 hypothetical protein [Mucilaginibacter dorajii]